MFLFEYMCCICSWEQNIAKMKLFSCSDCSQEQNVVKSGLFSCSQERNRAKKWFIFLFQVFSGTECSMKPRDGLFPGTEDGKKWFIFLFCLVTGTE